MPSHPLPLCAEMFLLSRNGVLTRVLLLVSVSASQVAQHACDKWYGAVSRNRPLTYETKFTERRVVSIQCVECEHPELREWRLKATSAARPKPRTNFGSDTAPAPLGWRKKPLGG